MLVYLVGPSGAGKSTTAAGAALQRPEMKHVDLDVVIRTKDSQLFFNNGDRWDEFWAFAVKCINELDQGPSEIYLIDCGAGCLQTKEALSFFETEPLVVAFIGSPAILFDRAKRSRPYWKDRPLQDFQSSQFSDRRQRIYDAAKLKLDVGALSEREAVECLLSFISKEGGGTGRET